jgi:hypothetical protein
MLRSPPPPLLAVSAPRKTGSPANSFERVELGRPRQHPAVTSGFLQLFGPLLLEPLTPPSLVASLGRAWPHARP